jgi:radical SAM superfamily enzyme YgiQ (UPF0313 family)
MNKKVLLVYPSSFPYTPEADIKCELYPSIPNGILSLASFIAQKGYRVKIIDARLYTKVRTKELVLKEIPDACCFGISAMSGQVRHGLQLSDLAKKFAPKLPIVWGGIHPTLFPSQTCANESVDYVIQGEGEYAFEKLLTHFNGMPIPPEEIEGLVYKKDDRVNMNAVGSPLDVEKLPDPNYNLLDDIEYYINRELFHYKGIKCVRGLDLHTSRGCPYRCSFCTNTLPCFKRWRSLNNERIIRLILNLINKYNLYNICFSYVFFFGNPKKTKDLITKIIESKKNFTWEANCRVDNFGPHYLNDEFLGLLKRSGCWALRMGIESGSQEVLNILKKDISVEQTVRAVRECYKFGIIPIGFFMIGIPGERMFDIEQTIALIIKLHEVNPDAILGVPGIFRPYPGTELYDKCKELGFKEPSTLRQWAEYDFGDPSNNLFVKAEDLPWVKNPRLLRDLGNYLFWYLDSDVNKNNSNYPLIRRIIGALSKLRLKKKIWILRWEPALARLIKKIRK